MCVSPGPPRRPASCPGLDALGVLTLRSCQSRACPCSSRACLLFSCGLSSQGHACLGLREGQTGTGPSSAPGTEMLPGRCARFTSWLGSGRGEGEPTPPSAVTRVPSPEERCFRVYTRHRRVLVCLCSSLRKVSADPSEAYMQSCVRGSKLCVRSVRLPPVQSVPFSKPLIVFVIEAHLRDPAGLIPGLCN